MSDEIKLKAEVAKLTAERDELKEKVMSLNADTTIWRMSERLGDQLEQINQLKAERDAAVVQGLEIAQEICQSRAHSIECIVAIAAEVAKRKEPA